MSETLENIDENPDSNEDENEEKEEEQNRFGNNERSQKMLTSATENNMADQDINAWRKRRSIAFQRQPMMFRRMSRGEKKTSTSIRID